MKAIPLLIAGIFLSLFCKAQTDSTQYRKKAFFKTSYDLLQYRPGELLTGGGAQLSFVNFSLAAGFYDKKERNFHEFALSRIYYTNNVHYHTVTDTTGRQMAEKIGKKKDFGIGFRYEYNLKLGKRNDRKSKFYIGFPVECYYVRQDFAPLYANSFNYHVNGFGLVTGVVPRYQYWFTKNFYLDIAIPITMYEGLVSHIKDSNVNKPVSERNTTDYRSYVGPPFPNFRIGLGIKI
ncbi:MAG: hypothetical protein V4615_00150 [Bacteroidota bacterium]